MTESKNTAECLGRQQAFAIVVNQCSAAQAECLKALHDSRAYQSYGLTWEQFCSQHAGVSRAQADRIISQLEEFGQNFFRLAQLIRISPDTYRQLNPQIEDETIHIDGETIPLNPDNTPRLRAAVERFRVQLQKTRKDAEAHDASLINLTDRIRAVVEELDKRSTLVLPDGEYAALKGLIEFSITNFTRLRHKYARRH
jgi:hypothetical protein